MPEPPGGGDYPERIVETQDSGLAAPDRRVPTPEARHRKLAGTLASAPPPEAAADVSDAPPAPAPPGGSPRRSRPLHVGGAGGDEVPEMAPYDLGPDDTGVVAAVPEVAPAVVAVVVTHDPGPWFRDTLAALAAQTYPNLSVLVVDAGSANDPTPVVAEVLPTAYVKRLEHNPGFGPAANEVLDLVDGAAFYCLCHDDIAPDPDAVRQLVEEAFRSNAGVIGPKLVDWDDPRILQQVGVAVDKAGVLAPYADPGELDQEQHDAVRDVFAVPSACTLVRADLFAAIGGYSPDIARHGEDLDLSWRSHVAGARVMVAPAARVRHREADHERGTDTDQVRLRARHRIRTLLTCYSRASLLWIVPQAVVVSLLEAVYGLVAGRTERSRAELDGWWWNFRQLSSLRARRRQLQAVRRVPDREIRNLQTRGSARVSAFIRGQLAAGDDQLRIMARRRRRSDPGRSGPRRVGVAAIVGVAIVLLAGSRGLLFGDLPAVGEFARFSHGPIDLLQSWWSGWRDVGLGATGGAPAGMGAFGLLGLVFFGAVGVLRKVAILAMLPLGAWGSWRLARPIGSSGSRAVALIVYVAIPVPYNAIAQGEWGALVTWAFAPWLLLGVCRAAGVAPYGRRGMPAATADTAATRPTRPLAAQSLGLGLAVAVAALVAPAAALALVVIAVGVVVGSLVVFRLSGSLRVVIATVGGLAVAGVLHLPWLLGFVHDGRQLGVLTGPRSAVGGSLPFAHLLRFESGPLGAAPLGWAFLVVAALPLLIGRGWRLEWAVRGWTVALAAWGLLWAGQAGWLHAALPTPDVLLAPAAAGLSLAAALGVAAFEVDLPSYRFGWRQLASVVAAAGLVAGVLPTLGAAVDGSWKLPSSGFEDTLSFIQSEAHKDPFRVLWVSDPDDLPVAGWRLDDHLSYGTSNQGLPSLGDRWANPWPGSSAQLGAAIRMALRGDTAQLGHLLAPLGVRYLAVPSQIAPLPSSVHHRPPPAALTAALDDQLDLQPLNALNPAITVWVNRAWRPTPVVLPAGSVADGSQLGDATRLVEPTQRTPLAWASDRRSAHGTIAEPGQLLVDQADDAGWKLRVDGTSMARSEAFGAVQRYDVTKSGSASLHYDTPVGWMLLAIGQVALWILLIVLWRRANGADRRRERREVQLPVPRTAADPVRERMWHQ